MLDLIDLRCPISLKIMKDPVKTVNNFTYDRKSIEKWFKTGNFIEPMTGQSLNDIELTINTEIANILVQRNTCSNCNTLLQKPKRCSGCNRVCYCNMNCQKTHWKKHKKNCTRENKQHVHT